MHTITTECGYVASYDALYCTVEFTEYHEHARKFSSRAYATVWAKARALTCYDMADWAIERIPQN